jgi:hypothetical protein
MVGRESFFADNGNFSFPASLSEAGCQLGCSMAAADNYAMVIVHIFRPVVRVKYGFNPVL